MRLDRYIKAVLSLIALFLGVIALRPVVSPPPALAGASSADLYFEPGVHMLRAPDGSKELLGKVVVDLRTGKVWAYPTLNNRPYPIDYTTSQPPVSGPFLLGRYDLAAMDK
jgi:hypothetical protein